MLGNVQVSIWTNFDLNKNPYTKENGFASFKDRTNDLFVKDTTKAANAKSGCTNIKCFVSESIRATVKHIKSNVSFPRPLSLTFVLNNYSDSTNIHHKGVLGFWGFGEIGRAHV